MALSSLALAASRCPRCYGATYRDYDGDYCCLICGECVYTNGAPVQPLRAPRPVSAAPLDGQPRKRGRPRKIQQVA